MQQKGTAFRSTLSAIERMHGETGLRAVKLALPEEMRGALDSVMPVSWHPIGLSAALHVAIRSVLGRGSWETSRTLGREAARMDYSGVYRVVLLGMQYDSVFSRLALAWRHYFSQGTLTWTHRGPGATTLHVSNVHGFNPGMWLASAGRAETLFTMSGAKAADVTVVEPTDRGATLEGIWLE